MTTILDPPDYNSHSDLGSDVEIDSKTESEDEATAVIKVNAPVAQESTDAPASDAPTGDARGVSNRATNPAFSNGDSTNPALSNAAKMTVCFSSK